jgi:alpha,alpha-trehalase
MKRVLLVVWLVVIFNSAFSQTLTPRQLFPGLFEAVQLSGIFPDNKTFVDATPLHDPATIMRDYISMSTTIDFNLKQFVTANFIIPGAHNDGFKSNVAVGIRKHIDTLWTVLYRKPDSIAQYSSLLQLPAGYVVPGGRFREMYYWDSYFTMLGLQESHKTEILQNMVTDFAYLIDKYGFIPNGMRTYYLTRSQPPYFSMMIDLLANDKGSKVLVKYQSELLKEYAFWMKGNRNLTIGQASDNVVLMPNGEVLNRYWDGSDKPREESYKKDIDAAKLSQQKPEEFYRNVRAAAESGWDFSSRWFSNPVDLGTIQTTDIIPVDLNCLIYHLELSIARSYRLQGDLHNYNSYLNKANSRKKAILKYCWNEKEGWFMDYNWKLKKASPVKSLAGIFPLEFNIADKKQANKVVLGLKVNFLKPGGLVTTLSKTGQQWDSPNAWAPLQYIAIDGLSKYHHTVLAQSIAERWISTNTRVFEQTGKLMEKYNVVDTEAKAGGGEYALQDGFGWTNGVLLNLMDHYPPSLRIKVE